MGHLVCVYNIYALAQSLTSSIRASELGVASWHADALGSPEFITLDRLSGHVVVAPIDVLHLKL
jgi:hypothetical protein